MVHLLLYNGHIKLNTFISFKCILIKFIHMSKVFILIRKVVLWHINCYIIIIIKIDILKQKSLYYCKVVILKNKYQSTKANWNSIILLLAAYSRYFTRAICSFSWSCPSWVQQTGLLKSPVCCTHSFGVMDSSLSQEYLWI